MWCEAYNLIARLTEQLRSDLQFSIIDGSQNSVTPFYFPLNKEHYAHAKRSEDNQAADYKQTAKTGINNTEEEYKAVEDATKLFRELMLVSHKSYLSLVSSAAPRTWWNGLLKYSPRSQHFKGFLEPTPLPCITPGEGARRGPKRNRKRAQETASERENTPKPKCKRFIGAEMSRETLTEREKLQMKEHEKAWKTFILSWSSDQMR